MEEVTAPSHTRRAVPATSNIYRTKQTTQDLDSSKEIEGGDNPTAWRWDGYGAIKRKRTGIPQAKETW
jgi:hypothetical protein